MLEFIAGLATGTSIIYALSGRRDRLERERLQRLATLKRAEHDVQDAVAMGLSADTCNSLRSVRDRAAAAYFAAP